ncbi:MAG: hypothetical protein ACRYFW_02305 [Janthinobacterium lividum]
MGVVHRADRQDDLRVDHERPELGEMDEAQQRDRRVEIGVVPERAAAGQLQLVAVDELAIDQRQVGARRQRGVVARIDVGLRLGGQGSGRSSGFTASPTSIWTSCSGMVGRRRSR